MPVFPSREWCEEAIRLINADPESPTAGVGWVGDVGVVVEAEPGLLAHPFVVHCVPQDGRIQHLRVLDEPEDLDEFEPAYLARAPYSVWKGLLNGTVDPVEAVLRRRLAIAGNLQPMVERMRYRGIADRLLASLSTTFVDEKR